MADNLTLYIEAGATFDAYSFRYLEDDKVTPVNLVGWTAKLQIRETPDSALALEVTPTINTTQALIEFTLTPAQTSSLTLSKYVWALELTKTSTGQVVRLVEGKVVVSPEVVK